MLCCLHALPLLVLMRNRTFFAGTGSFTSNRGTAKGGGFSSTPPSLFQQPGGSGGGGFGGGAGFGSSSPLFATSSSPLPMPAQLRTGLPACSFPVPAHGGRQVVSIPAGQSAAHRSLASSSVPVRCCEPLCAFANNRSP